jgi:methionine sulfoxide reductase catalytic subunit
MKTRVRKNYTELLAEITPEQLYLNRRQFMKAAGLVLGGTLLAACAPQPAAAPPNQPTLPSTQVPVALPSSTPQAKIPLPATSKGADEYGDALTSEETATSYNNFYEFTYSKDNVKQAASAFQTSPWTVEVSGLVSQPKTYTMDDLLKQFSQEERIYRMRCVEGWSMVIPWQGFSLSKLLAEVQPTSAARYVSFSAVLRPAEMPGQKSISFSWPYQEGLRLDEALHDLTILATGMYGKPLPVQDGAPIRLVVPWKYGFKSIKSIAKIELVAEQPATLWNSAAPDEYGFYSNVNPNRPHPRWSQASEERLGEDHRRPTLIFNGYADQVASLYAGMDLIKKDY